MKLLTVLGICRTLVIAGSLLATVDGPGASCAETPTDLQTSNASIIDHMPYLGFSPSGAFLVGRDSAHDLAFMATECALKSQLADCPAYIASGFNAQKTYFWTGSQRVGRVKYDGTVITYDLNCLFSRAENCRQNAFQFDDRAWASSYFDVSPNPKGFAQLRQDAQPAITAAQSLSAGNIGENARDVYGLIYGTRSVYLHRTNAYDMYLGGSNIKERLFDSEGQAYDSPTENLDFRQDAHRFYVRASGSILTIGPKGGEVNLTKALPETHFIEDSDLSAYAGYYTAATIVPFGATQSLINQADAFLRAHPGVFITDVAINRSTNDLAVTYKDRIEPFAVYRNHISGGNSYAHYVVHLGQVVDTDHELGTPFSYQIRQSCAETCLWVESYVVSTAARTIVFVHGGPEETADILQDDALRLLLDRGFNVDVVDYAGSTFTYELATRLARDGQASLRHDADAIQAFVSTRYAGRHDVTLLLSSFGGMFYRYFDPSFLRTLDLVILDHPAGSIHQGFNAATPVIAAHYAKTMGTAWPAGRFDNAFYNDLSHCQIASPTVLIYGLEDQNVDPRFDYRYCLSDPNVRLVPVAGGHNDNSEAAYMLVARIIAERNSSSK